MEWPHVQDNNRSWPGLTGVRLGWASQRQNGWTRARVRSWKFMSLAKVLGLDNSKRFKGNVIPDRDMEEAELLGRALPKSMQA